MPFSFTLLNILDIKPFFITLDIVFTKAVSALVMFVKVLAFQEWLVIW